MLFWPGRFARGRHLAHRHNLFLQHNQDKSRRVCLWDRCMVLSCMYRRTDKWSCLMTCNRYVWLCKTPGSRRVCFPHKAGDRMKCQTCVVSSLGCYIGHTICLLYSRIPIDYVFLEEISKCLQNHDCVQQYRYKHYHPELENLNRTGQREGVRGQIPPPIFFLKSLTKTFIYPVTAYQNQNFNRDFL